MNKRMMLAALLLVSVAVAVSGTDFEERISSRIWIRDYFNEVIYRKDRNIIVEYQPYLTEEENISFYDGAYDDMIYWFTESAFYRDRITWNKLDDGEYSYYVNIGAGGFRYKAKKLTPDLYELELEDVRISQHWYGLFLKYGHDMKFALNATEPGYSLYFRFDGEYLYIYLEDGKTLYATYCAYDESEEEALYEAIRTNEFDMTKITFPRHGDGTCDYESGGGVPGKKIVNGVYRAKENLRFRETGSISGKAITTMQADTYVRILSLGKEETIDGITDNWVEVETLFGAKNLEDDFLYGKTGWCFGGYLKTGEYEESELFDSPETANETESEVKSIRERYPSKNTTNPYPHEGVDFEASYGTGVYATICGIVLAIKDQKDKHYGYHVLIHSDDGYIFLLGHLSSICVEINQRITPNTLVAKVGNSGNCYTSGHKLTPDERAKQLDAHLHLSVFKGKQIKDIYNAKEDSYTYSEKLVNPFHREHNWKKDIL